MSLQLDTLFVCKMLDVLESRKDHFVSVSHHLQQGKRRMRLILAIDSGKRTSSGFDLSHSLPALLVLSEGACHCSPFPTVAEAVQTELDQYRASEDEVKRLKGAMVKCRK